MSGSEEPVLAAIAQLGVQIGRIDERVGQLTGRVDRLSGEVTQLRVDVMSRMDRQQDMLTRIKDDINVNVAATDNVRERYNAFRNDYDQLAHQVSVVHRRLMQLEQRFDSKENGA